MTRAAIGLGANLGDPVATVRAAIADLAACGALLAVSSLYRTEPREVLDQPSFVNAVALLETTAEPRALLLALFRIERAHGRVPGPRFGPRALDLDLLSYGALILDTPDLTLPHPRMYERAFVLVPLAQIDPAYAAARDALPERERLSVLEIPDLDGQPTLHLH